MDGQDGCDTEVLTGRRFAIEFKLCLTRPLAFATAFVEIRDMIEASHMLIGQENSPLER